MQAQYATKWTLNLTLCTGHRWTPLADYRADTTVKLEYDNDSDRLVRTVQAGHGIQKVGVRIPPGLPNFEFRCPYGSTTLATFIRPYDTLLALYRAQESALILGLVRPGQEDLTKPLGGRNKCTILRLGRAADPGPSGPSLGACYWPLNTW